MSRDAGSIPAVRASRLGMACYPPLCAADGAGSTERRAPAPGGRIISAPTRARLRAGMGEGLRSFRVRSPACAPEDWCAALLKQLRKSTKRCDNRKQTGWQPGKTGTDPSAAGGGTSPDRGGRDWRCAPWDAPVRWRAFRDAPARWQASEKWVIAAKMGGSRKPHLQDGRRQDREHGV